MSYDKIKPEIIESLRRYADHHVPTGGFLRAVLSNDLLEAVIKADDDNRTALVDIVGYCYEEIPHDCWGSPERVRAWLATGIQRADKMLEHHLGEQGDGTFKVGAL
jgi:hypothetical protein